MHSDPQLDFLSSCFDPLRALHEPGLQPPIPDAPTLDNIAKCLWLLPDDHPDRSILVGQKRTSEAAREVQKRFKERADRAISRILGGDKTPILRQLMGKCEGGWLEPLQDCVKERWKVRVTVAGPDYKEPRGTATGLLTYFDPQCNLILRDVEESFSAPSTSGQGREGRTRQLKHVMLMCDQVVRVEADKAGDGAFEPLVERKVSRKQQERISAAGGGGSGPGPTLGGAGDTGGTGGQWTAHAPALQAPQDPRKRPREY